MLLGFVSLVPISQQRLTAFHLSACPVKHNLVVYLQADKCPDHAAPLLCGPASQQLSDWVHQTHRQQDASHSSSLYPAACVELFSRVSALFMPPGSTQALWQLAAAVAAHLPGTASSSSVPVGPTAAGDEQLARSASGMQLAGLSNTHSLSKSMAGGCGLDGRSSSIGCGTSNGSSCCTGPGCMCHLVKVRSSLVSAANQLELSVRGRGVGRACIGAAHREEVLQEAAMMHLQAVDAEHCCELLVEVRDRGAV